MDGEEQKRSITTVALSTQADRVGYLFPASSLLVGKEIHTSPGIPGFPLRLGQGFQPRAMGVLLAGTPWLSLVFHFAAIKTGDDQ